MNRKLSKFNNSIQESTVIASFVRTQKLLTVLEFMIMINPIAYDENIISISIK